MHRPASRRRFTLISLFLNSLLVGGLPTTATAQSAQKYAFQVAALATSIGVGVGGTSTNGIGIEPQLDSIACPQQNATASRWASARSTPRTRRATTS